MCTYENAQHWTETSIPIPYKTDPCFFLNNNLFLSLYGTQHIKQDKVAS